MILFASGNNKSNQGRVAAFSLRGFASAGTILQVDDWDGFSAMRAIFTNVRVSKKTNHQFQQMLGSSIYLYVFGDRIGSILLNGYAFDESCDGARGQSGLSKINDYFDRAKLSARAEPLRISIDPSTTFEAYLHGFDAASVVGDGSLHNTYQFSLQLSLVPEVDQQISQENIDEEG